EIADETRFTLHPEAVLADLAEAVEEGVPARPVVVGPATFLALSKAAPGAGEPWERLDDLAPLYQQLLSLLRAGGAGWVQLDEPALVTDLDAAQLEKVTEVYGALTASADRPAVCVATYFGDPGPALEALGATEIDAVAVDLVAGGPGAVAAPTAVRDPGLRAWLAFAEEKYDEVRVLADALRDGRDSRADAFDRCREALAARASDPRVRDMSLRGRVDALRSAGATRAPAAERAAAQRARLGLPTLPTTTIGSFPQTDDIRRARAAHRNGRLDDAAYTDAMRDEIRRVIELQERLGLDVLVHGEPERNDMVQYFAELLDGFATTAGGWVQSY